MRYRLLPMQSINPPRFTHLSISLIGQKACNLTEVQRLLEAHERMKGGFKGGWDRSIKS